MNGMDHINCSGPHDFIIITIIFFLNEDTVKQNWKEKLKASSLVRNSKAF